jgi:hypothetical protein
MTTRTKKAGGGNPPATTTRRLQSYVLSRPESSAVCPGAWLDRTALVLAALVVNLQEAVHLDPAEREGGWALFERLLHRYVSMKHRRTA